MALTDPVDARLLAILADAGRVAIPELAARAGMDAREVAARLTALSGGGLPVVVGAECNPQALRQVLSAGGWGPAAAPPQQTPSSQAQSPAGQSSAGQRPPDPVHTWGPPQTAGWARGDRPPRRAGVANRTGEVGQALDAEGPEGERLRMQIVEVMDPADFLFTAAGHRLADGERAVVVHSELTNTGGTEYGALPDQHLMLVATDGSQVSKAPVTLASRPAHRTGLAPGHTAGGHTVYVLPESTALAAISWSPQPDAEQHALTWRITD